MNQHIEGQLHRLKPLVSEAIFYFKASQGEVALSSPLKGSEIVALTGASSPHDELCERIGIPETERDEYFKKLIDLGRYPGVLNVYV